MVMSGFASRLWPYESQPQFWSKYQVWEWLQQVLDMHQIDASNIPFQNFDMDGHQLCSLTYHDFIRAAGSMGTILFHSLTELKWSGASECLRRGWGGWGGAKRAKQKTIIGPDERRSWFELVVEQCWWSDAEEGSQSRSGVTLPGAGEVKERSKRGGWCICCLLLLERFF